MCIILISTHIVSVLNKGITINQITFVIIGIISVAVIKENRFLYFISFLLSAIFCTLTLSNLAELTPFVFFFLSVVYYRRIIYVIPGVLIASFVFSYYINDYNNYMNLIEGIFANLAYLILFCIVFIKQPTDIKYLSMVTPLSKRQLLILKKLSEDIPRKQIPSKTKDLELWNLDLTKDKFTVDIINTEISKIKKTLKINNEMCLGIWYKEQ